MLSLYVPEYPFESNAETVVLFSGSPRPADFAYSLLDRTCDSNRSTAVIGVLSDQTRPGLTVYVTRKSVVPFLVIRYEPNTLF